MILITGATGHIGSHLALLLLEQGESFRALYRDEKSKLRTKALLTLYKKTELFEKIEWQKADILDLPSLEKAFEDITHVYHCAALVSFDPNDEEALRKTNIEGTANIVNCCLAHKIEKLCHVSSIAALGDLKDHETGHLAIVDEETEWNPEKPHSDYAITKHGAEMEIWRGQQEGLNVVIVNPGIVIGPPLWDTGSATLFKMAAKGQRFYTNGTMGFIGAKDVAEIMRILMESGISGERFILSSQTLTYREVFSLVARALGKKSPSVYATPWLLSVAWRLDWILANIFRRKRIISKDDARTLHTTAHYSNDKIREATGYVFTEIADVIKQTTALGK